MADRLLDYGPQVEAVHRLEDGFGCHPPDAHRTLTFGEHRTGRLVRNGFPPVAAVPGVSFPRPDVDIGTPPLEFDDLVEWLERWSYRLVLLEEYPLVEIRKSLAAVEDAVRRHRVDADRWLGSITGADEDARRGTRVIESDHVWFETSLAQFWWFFRVVEKEDHGGHRQALGQYGRVLAEALQRHRSDERRLERQLRVASTRPVSLPQETLKRSPGRAP